MRALRHLCLLLAFAAGLAHAQAQAPTVVPIRDVENDRVEAFLLLDFPQSGTTLDRLLESSSPRLAASPGLVLPSQPRLRPQLSLDSGNSLGLLCQGRSVTTTLGSLAQHCLLSDLQSPASPALLLSKPGPRAGFQLQTRNASLDAGFGTSGYTLQGALSPLTVQENNFGLGGQLKLGHEGWISIGGTWAHARVVSAAELPGLLPPQWRSRSLSLGAGVGNFGGELVSSRIRLPGQTRDYSTVGVGVTWKTPWRARLSVGAENLVSRGRSPFALPQAGNAAKDDEGRVPYVRYQQDL